MQRSIPRILDTYSSARDDSTLFDTTEEQLKCFVTGVVVDSGHTVIDTYFSTTDTAGWTV